MTTLIFFVNTEHGMDFFFIKMDNKIFLQNIHNK